MHDEEILSRDHSTHKIVVGSCTPPLSVTVPCAAEEGKNLSRRQDLEGRRRKSDLGEKEREGKQLSGT